LKSELASWGLTWGLIPRIQGPGYKPMDARLRFKKQYEK